MRASKAVQHTDSRSRGGPFLVAAHALGSAVDGGRGAVLALSIGICGVPSCGNVCGVPSRGTAAPPHVVASVAAPVLAPRVCSIPACSHLSRTCATISHWTRAAGLQRMCATCR